jgi:hypothetical protein
MRLLPCLVLIALLAGQSTAAAQGVSGGVKAGVNFATLSSDEEDSEDLGYRTGLIAGGFVTWPITANFAIQPEGLYSQKGAAIDMSGVEAKIKIDYFEVPVLAVFSTHSGGASAHFYGGPFVVFKVNTEATATFGGQTTSEDFDEEIKDVDFGVAFGGGVEFGRLTVEGRYSLGLSNINNQDLDESKVKTRTISLIAGVRF